MTQASWQQSPPGPLPWMSGLSSMRKSPVIKVLSRVRMTFSRKSWPKCFSTHAYWKHTHAQKQRWVHSGCFRIINILGYLWLFNFCIVQDRQKMSRGPRPISFWVTYCDLLFNLFILLLRCCKQNKVIHSLTHLGKLVKPAERWK